jgi:hypothetical protein
MASSTFSAFFLVPEDGAWRFQPFWGHNRAAERQAFERFIDFASRGA